MHMFYIPAVLCALSTGLYSEQYVLEFYTKTLLSKPCQNQGFVLDGFPKTVDQAKPLFEGGFFILSHRLPPSSPSISLLYYT